MVVFSARGGGVGFRFSSLVFQSIIGLTCHSQSWPRTILQDPSRGVTKKSHWKYKPQANLIGRLTTWDTRVFTVPSIRDRDKGETVRVNSLEYAMNAELMKQLDKPKSSRPLNGGAMSGDHRSTCSALESRVLVAPSFRSAPWKAFR